MPEGKKGHQKKQDGKESFGELETLMIHNIA